VPDHTVVWFHGKNMAVILLDQSYNNSRAGIPRLLDREMYFLLRISSFYYRMKK